MPIENVKAHEEKQKMSDKFEQPFVNTRSAARYKGMINNFNLKKQKKFNSKRKK